VARSRLRFEAARCGGHADVAFPCGVMSPRGSCPPSHCRPRGGAGSAEVVDVGRHRVVWEAGLSTGVYHGVSLHELHPAQWFVSAGLEGKVGEVVGVEPKCSCVGFGPNMPMMTSSEKPRTKASRPAAAVRTLGRGGRAKVRPATDSAGPM
jgi:hypothetical protein